MTQTSVIHEKRDHAFWITINRPEKRNALNGEVIEGIRDGLKQAQADNEIRVVVLGGAGDKAFCAGADLSSRSGFDLSQPNRDYADMLRDFQRCTLPTVARVRGVCMAGGMGLLCMVDMAVASEDAQFGLPEVRIGLFPMQVLSLLKDLAGERQVREWALTGMPFDAAAAQAHGLLNRVVPVDELDKAVEKMTRALAGSSPTAIRHGKYAMRAMRHMNFDQAIAYTENQIALLAFTEDAKEGRASFNEKRAPVWTGR